MFAHCHGANTPAIADTKLQTLHMKLEKDPNNHFRRAGISWLQRINHCIGGCNVFFAWPVNLKTRLCKTHYLLKRIRRWASLRES